MSRTLNIKIYYLIIYLVLVIHNIFHNRFYLSKYKGRRLTLQPQFGSVDLDAVFYGSKLSLSKRRLSSSDNSLNTSTVRKHIIQVSTYQMCILLMFNNHEKLSFEVNYYYIT